MHCDKYFILGLTTRKGIKSIFGQKTSPLRSYPKSQNYDLRVTKHIDLVSNCYFHKPGLSPKQFPKGVVCQPKSGDTEFVE